MFRGPARFVDASDPRRPFLPVPAPRRPYVRGDALALADRAFDQRDFVDAVAQYTTLLRQLPSNERLYVQIHLAHAYVALDRVEDAISLLNGPARQETLESLPAVFALATILLTNVGADPVEVWQALSPYAGPAQEDLANHVLQLAHDEGAARLSLVLSSDIPISGRKCASELAAFLVSYPSVMGWRWCPLLEMPSTVANKPSSSVSADFRMLGHLVDHFQRLYREPSTAVDWTNDAMKVATIIPRMRDPVAADLASWLVMIMYENARIVATHTTDGIHYVNMDWHAWSEKQIDLLSPGYREPTRKIAASFMRVAP